MGAQEMNTALIFDMDGTLIDVSKSYKEAIVQTVQHVVPNAGRQQVYEEMGLLVGKTGFNNDWDASVYIINKLLGQKRPVVRDDAWEEVKDIFQSYYLGAGLYWKSYGKAPPIAIKQGLISNETVLIREDTLRALSGHPLAIATSRTRFEALFALGASYLGTYFDALHVTTQDDVKHEKPHPEPILAAKKAMAADECIYIGNTIDDATAAKAAGCKSIIVGGDWGDVRVDDINDVAEALSSCSNTASAQCPR